MKSFRVLCLSRRDLLKRRGGDTVQIENTMKYINKRHNIEYEIKDVATEKDIVQFDVVHIFGIVRIDEAYNYVKLCKKHNKLVVLSPIYWNFSEYNLKGRYGLLKYAYRILDEDTIEKIKNLIRNIKDNKIEMLDNISIHNKRKYVLNNADIILPNSNIEMERIIEEFKLDKPVNYRVVPNAIDKFFLETTITQDEIKRTREMLFGENIPYVICVARFDPRKNQLRLIEAIKRIKLPLLLLGNWIDTQKYYFRLIKKSIKNVDFIKIESYKNQRELIKFYSSAKVHVLPSWAETPGLVNIEAAACGCNLVVSNRGSEYEYFGEYASYCDPEDVSSIAESICKEYYSNKNNKKLVELITNRYVWEEVADTTFDSYKQILFKNGYAKF